MPFCVREGCTNKTRGTYCAQHLNEVRMCAVEGCPGRLGPHNRRGYCYEHRYIATKLKAIARELAERGEE